jgi:HK97 family phage prohead protease
MRDVLALTLSLVVAAVRDLTRRRPAVVRFDDAGPEVRLDAPGAVAFKVDREARTIRGLAVPYGIPATSGGRQYRFGPDSLAFASPSRVKLWVQHDAAQAVGVMFEAVDGEVTLEDGSTVPGKVVAFKVARGPEGDRALTLAEDGVLDGLSVGLAQGGTYTQAEDGVFDVVSAPWMETSLTPAPAFDDARVHSVAATAARLTPGGNMKCTKCGLSHDAAVACDPTALAAFAAQAATPPGTVPAGAEFSLDALVDRFAQAVANAPRPEVVPAGAEFEVDEALPYRFDGLDGGHDFSSDLIAYGRDRDGEAGSRLMSFMSEAFAPGHRNPRFDVATGNVATVNPARQRPDMFVDEREFRTPVYDALYSGALTDSTPFVVPKFTSDADLVNEHVEGVEPAAGGYVAGSQTVTPTALSGKVPITREVWDQGGNPQVSGLIWARMRYEFYRNLEAAAAAVLTAAAGSIANIDLTAGAADDVLVNALEAALVDLQFVAGGDTISTAMTHVDLYKALAGAVDSTGRKLLPLYGVTNGSGQARPRFASLDVGGYEFAPAWSLGATSAGPSNSWLFDKGSVHLWNSAPTRLEFEYRVAFVDLAVWGYKAAAVTDTAGVRQITYDPIA